MDLLFRLYCQNKFQGSCVNGLNDEKSQEVEHIRVVQRSANIANSTGIPRLARKEFEEFSFLKIFKKIKKSI